MQATLVEGVLRFRQSAEGIKTILPCCYAGRIERRKHSGDLWCRCALVGELHDDAVQLV